MKNEVEEKTGYVSADVKFKEFESGKKLSTFQIGVNIGVGEDKKTEWVSVQAWEDLALKVQDFKKGLKVTVTGTAGTYKNKEGVEKPVFNATQINEHKKIVDLELTVGNVEFKTPRSKELVELALYDNSVEGNDAKYSVSAFDQTKMLIRDMDLKPGDKVKLNGDVEVVNYLGKDGEEKTALQGKIYTLDLVERAKEKTQDSSADKKEESKEDKSKETAQKAKKTAKAAVVEKEM